MLWWKALVLGVVEGVTEFLPVSSTGHLILVSAIVDYPEPQRATFDIFIQLGAILAVVWLYRRHLGSLLARAPTDTRARSLLGKVALAFLPSGIAGYSFHSVIESHLFTPAVVAYALIIGGLVLLWVDSRNYGNAVQDIESVTWTQAFWIGFAQTASLIPGVSRAGATIVGGLLSGLSRPVATQFSFYLSIPTLGAASLYSLYKARQELVLDDIVALSLGFTTAFVSAAIVVEGFIRFVQRHTFFVFAVYRVALGLLVLLSLV